MFVIKVVSENRFYSNFVDKKILYSDINGNVRVFSTLEEAKSFIKDLNIVTRLEHEIKELVFA